MRVGDFSVEIVPTDGEGVLETASGHVLARPGQVYALRLRNHGPLRAVADISIDGHPVTGGGLVIAAGSSVNLERPIHATERGRFTVIAEGNEHVFGPDGGRDNANLGLIDARFRRELPHSVGRVQRIPEFPFGRPDPLGALPSPTPEQSPDVPSRRGMEPPVWGSPPDVPIGSSRGLGSSGGPDRHDRREQRQPSAISALMAPTMPAEAPAAPTHVRDAIERAAGTGLTGSSRQEFMSVYVGPLETEATVIQLRLVIGTDEALTAARPLPGVATTPARPAPRP